MGEFFNVNNKFFQGINKLIDCILLNVLWCICCIPTILTGIIAWQSGTLVGWLICWVTSLLAGPATTALYYTVNKVIRHDRGYVFGEYWRAFRNNFKQAAVAGLVVAGLVLFMAMDCYIMYQFAAAGESIGSTYIVFLVFALLIAVWGTYVFGNIARFENGTKQMFRNATLMAVANLPWTAVLFVLLIVTIILVSMIPLTIVVAPVGYMLSANGVLEKVFIKYMSEEDIAAEEERNQEFFN